MIGKNNHFSPNIQGNDQIRFELSYYSLFPKAKVKHSSTSYDLEN